MQRVCATHINMGAIYMMPFFKKFVPRSVYSLFACEHVIQVMHLWFAKSDFAKFYSAILCHHCTVDEGKITLTSGFNGQMDTIRAIALLLI